MADNNMDISFEEHKLSELKNEINAELSSVRRVLQQVAEECEKNPEDDTILLEIQKVGKELEGAWDNLCNTFDKVTVKMGELFSGYNKTATDQKNNAQDMNRGL